jgi:hypothetical protein
MLEKWENNLKKHKSIIFSFQQFTDFFQITWYFMSGNELAVYQKLLPFTLQVRAHNFNNRELYQFYDFMDFPGPHLPSVES